MELKTYRGYVVGIRSGASMDIVDVDLCCNGVVLTLNDVKYDPDLITIDARMTVTAVLDAGADT